MTASPAPWRCGYCLRMPPYAQRHGNSVACDRCRADLAAKGKKLCNGCKQVKLLDAFTRHSNGKVQGRCRDCNRPAKRAGLAQWRRDNRETVKAHQRRYIEKHPNTIKAQAARWYQNKKARIWRGVLTLEKDNPDV